jgi:hypothetical protein
MMAAIASAPVTRLNEKSLMSGRCGSGMPRGISPWSPTLATVSALASTTTTVGITSAISALTTERRVRASTSKIASALSPVSSDASWMLPGWISTLTALAKGKSPCVEVPVRPAI